MSDELRRELEEIKKTLEEIRRSLPMITPYYPVTYNMNDDNYAGPVAGYNPDFGKREPKCSWFANEPDMKELLERAGQEHKAVLDYLKDK